MAAGKRAKGAGRPENWVPSNTLGGRIRAARKTAGLSLIALGKMTGFSHVTISDTERGITNPEKHTLISLAQALRDDFGESWLREHIKPEPDDLTIDITARVAAGDAVEFFLEGEDKDSITVDPRMIYKKGKYFGLRVDGESMVDAAILTGDVVIVRELNKGQKPRRDDIVVADIRAEGITLKRWTETDAEAILIPASKSHEPMHRERWRVKPVAVVVGVIRMIQ